MEHYHLLMLLKKRLRHPSIYNTHYKKLCGSGYTTDYQDYLCKDEFGFIKSGYISKKFQKILIANHFRIIQSHDLRHYCARLLIAEDIPLKDIQEWLGDSTFPLQQISTSI